MLENGWLKIHRKIVDWEWYSDAKTFRVFLHLLLTANHEERRFRGQTIGKGELVTGRKILAKTLMISEQSVRTSLEHLKSTNEITIKSTKDFSIIKLNNWDKYQEGNQQINQQSTNNQPTINHTTRIKELRIKNNTPIAADAAPRLSEVKILEHVDPSPKALLEDPKHHVRVIGLFALAKGVTFENREQRDSFIRRNVRAAADLKGYETDRVKQVMDWLNQNADYKWTLESVGKHIDEYGRLVKQGESLEDALKKIQQADYGN